MRLRSLLRTGLLLAAALVALTVVWQWRPERRGEGAANDVPPLALPEVSAERPAESVTRALDVLVSNNGRPVYRVHAAEHVDFVDGWNEWSGPPLGLVVYGQEGQENVVVQAEGMRTAGDVDQPDEVRMIGDVVAELPGGGRFTTQRVDFDAVDGLVHTCRRSELVYAGIQVRSDCLEFRTAGSVSRGDALVAETLRMYGDLRLAGASGESAGLPEGLAGAGEELLFRPGGEAVTLRGAPRLSFGRAQVHADEMVLDVDLKADRLRDVNATGQARLRLERAATDGPAAADAPGSLVLRGDRLAIDFGQDAALRSVAAVSVGTEGARLVLAGRGVLVAGAISLHADAGSAMGVEATGGVLWEAEDAALLGGLNANAMTLSIDGEGRLEGLVARGEVVATLAHGSARRRFSGPRLELRWSAGDLRGGGWPDGVTIELPDGRLSAAMATYEPAARTWELTGTPVPRLAGSGLELNARRIVARTTGTVEASGDVRIGLSEERLLLAGALFGDAPTVAVRATAASLQPGGRIELEGAVEATWGERSLFAQGLELETDPGRLRATGQVELIVLDEGATAERERFMTLVTDALLVEQDSRAIHAAGSCVLRRGDRHVRAERFAVHVDEAGRWSRLEADGSVEFRDPDARGTGEGMVYDLNSGEILLTGTEEAPARFEYGDLSYDSTELLRVVFEPEQLIIETSENGRTRTRPVRRVEGEAGS